MRVCVGCKRRLARGGVVRAVASNFLFLIGIDLCWESGDLLDLSVEEEVEVAIYHACLVF